VARDEEQTTPHLRLSVPHTLTPGAVKSSDYDYALPRADLTIKREVPRDTGLANQEYFDLRTNRGERL